MSRDNVYDYYTFTLPRKALVTIKNVKLSGESAGTLLTDSNGNKVSKNQSYNNSTSGIVEQYSLAVGTYYIRFSSRYEVALFSSTTGGGYSFSVTASGANVSFEEPIGGSNNTIPSASGDLAIGGMYVGRICANDDVDFYRFVKPANAKVTLRIETLDGGPLAYYICNHEGKYSDSFSTSKYNQINYSLTSGGTYYYVKVYGTNQGGYRFSLGPEDGASITGASFTNLNKSYTYTGKAYKPAVKVTAYGTTLIQGKDYTVTYQNCVNAGTATAVIQGKGWYRGTKKLTYKIGRRNLSSASIASVAKQPCTGSAIKPRPQLKYGGKVLKLGTDYTLSYSNNVKSGTATVIATGKGNFTGRKNRAFTIYPGVAYFVHRQTYGWETAWSKKNGAQSGTTGQYKRLEGIRIRLQGANVSGAIQYRTHVQTIGWQGWRSNGAMSGTSHMAKRLEAIQIRLTGQMAKKYDVFYRVHAQTYGWMGWAKNGARAGTAGYAKRLESIQIVILPKGSKAPAASFKGARQNTAAPFRQKR